MGKVKSIFKSKAFLYILLVLFCFLLACLCKEYDYDLFARLIVGENFVKTGSVAYQDFLSYTQTHFWFDHEWGSGVVFYLFLKVLGPIGLIILQAITMFLTIFFIIKTQKLQNPNYPISTAFIFCFLLVFSHLNPSIIRCHMFTFMFYAMTLYLLEKTRKTDSNLIWLIVPISLFWGNLHGGIASGLGMIFIYMICQLIQRKKWIKFLKVLIASTAILLINPYGIGYLDFLLFAYSIPRDNITEWMNVFANRHILYYFPAFFICITSTIFAIFTILKRKKLDLTKFFASVITVALGTLHVKLLPIAVITLAALYYNEISNLFSKKAIKTINKIAYIFMIIGVFYLPFTNPHIAKTNFYKFPIQEVEFLRTNNIKGNIFTDFELGSYVSYKLYPENLIFMDGRFESVYYDREFQNLVNFENGKPNWDNVITQYPTQIIIAQNKTHGYEKINKHPSWEKIYQGVFAGVFMKKNKNNKYINPSSDIKYYQKTLFDNLGHFGS